MIKFFRHIRRQLLVEGKMGKYLQYAIGEIVLVVIGILIALQVNNWNIKKINENLEQQILIELKKEYKSNLIQLQEKNQIREGLIMRSTEWLIKQIDNQVLEINIDSLNHHLSRTLLVPTYDPIISVTTELINAGQLKLIQNQELKTKLTKWPSVTNDLVGEEIQYVKFIYENYMFFVLKNYKMRPLVRLLQNDKSVLNILKVDHSHFNLNYKNNNDEINELFDNKDFEDYLSLIMGFCNFLNNTTNVLIENNKEIIKLIDVKIKH